MAERSLTPAMLSAISQGVVRPALLYEGEFISGGNPAFLRLWTGIGDLIWDGKTWTGGGNLLSISLLKETADVQAVGFTVTLSGMPSSNVSLALQSIRQNRPGKIWLALFDDTGALIADPYLARRGRVDVSVIEDDGFTSTIAVQYEDRLVDLERPRERRYTHEDQQIDAPGDLGFEFVPTLQDKQLVWGR